MARAFVEHQGRYVFVPEADPTPAEIAARAAAIRDAWSERERRERGAWAEAPWHVPRSSAVPPAEETAAADTS
jgi:hypothetical protein